jgi:adenine-specific DNA methylase
MVAPNLVKKFNALGFTFTKYGPNVAISDETRNLAAEVDIFLENGDCAIAVEVKVQVDVDDVKEHAERMETLRHYADARQDTRKFYGAVAGAIIHDSVRKYALKSGFYVISQSGDTMEIDVPEGFNPRAW